MKNLIILTLALILNACGGSSGGSGGSPNEDKSEQAKDEAGEQPGSIYLESKAQLPKCKDTNESQLAYVKAEATFYVCESGSWENVDVRGKDAPLLSSNQWYDPITGLTWLIAGQSSGTNPANYCDGAYQLPDNATLVAAMEHGITYKMLDLGVDDEAWTSELATNDGSGNPRRSVGKYTGTVYAAGAEVLTNTNTVACYTN